MAVGPPAPVRLAILEADIPQPRTLSRVGPYSAVFASLLARAAAPQALDELVHINAYDVVSGDGAGESAYPPLEDVDALLITGSRHTAFDDDAWIVQLVDYVRRAIETGRVRVVGVCFGHQIVGRAMGARVGKSENGWEVAVTEVELTERGRALFALEKLRIHQMHRDVVFELPDGDDAVSLGHNAKCAVQAMYRPGRYLTLQGHPEFTEEIVAEIVENRHRAGVFSEEMYGDAMRRVGGEHDGVAVARALLRFMMEG